jgi:ABC-type branched-subunit amino acid transport system ATPase component
VLETRALCKSFGGLAVTRDVSLRLEKGERRVVLGPNGAGKTTLFNLLAGTLRADSGEVLVDGRPVTRLKVEERARLGIARSYQKNNLFEGLSVAENLGLAATVARGWTRSPVRSWDRDPEIRDLVAEVAALVGLTEVLGLSVRDASYGNRRQLEVGLALAARPRILLMDEPTSGVGPGMMEAFRALLAGLPRDLTVLIIEHDLDLGFAVADRITVLNYGEVVFEGTPEETRASQVVREIYLGDWQGHA